MLEEQKKLGTQQSVLAVSSLRPIPSDESVIKASVTITSQFKAPVKLKVSLIDSEKKSINELETSLTLKAGQSIEIAFKPSEFCGDQQKEAYLEVQMSSDSAEALSADAVSIQAQVTKKPETQYRAPAAGAYAAAIGGDHGSTIDPIPMGDPYP